MRDPSVEDVLWSLEDAGWRRRGNDELDVLSSPDGQVLVMVSLRWIVMVTRLGWKRAGDLGRGTRGAEDLVRSIEVAIRLTTNVSDGPIG